MATQKDLIAELHNMIQNFLTHEEKTLSEAPAEFQSNLQNTLREVISSLFLNEIQKVADIKLELGFISEKIKQEREKLTEKLTLFLADFPDFNRNSEGFIQDLQNLKEEMNNTVIEMHGYNQRSEPIKKTLKKLEDNKTPKGNGLFYNKKPRAGNVIFLEKRMKEMFPSGASMHDFKNNLKLLFEEWHELAIEFKATYEKQAEQEFIEYYLKTNN